VNDEDDAANDDEGVLDDAALAMELEDAVLLESVPVLEDVMGVTLVAGDEEDEVPPPMSEDT
jgi:hypothetical protein